MNNYLAHNRGFKLLLGISTNLFVRLEKKELVKSLKPIKTTKPTKTK